MIAPLEVPLRPVRKGYKAFPVGELAGTHFGDVRRYTGTPLEHGTHESHCPSFCNCRNPVNDGQGDCIMCGRIIKTEGWRAAV
jgi:hypothetical protein